MNQTTKKRGRFLVCIAIVACLTTLGARQWIQAKEYQNRLTIHFHMMALSRAMSDYLRQHKNVFPEVSHWEKAVAPYLSTQSGNSAQTSVRDLTRVPVLFWQAERRIVMNRSLSKRSCATIDEPDSTVLFFESMETGSPSNDLSALKITTSTRKMARVTFVSGWVLQVSDSCPFDYCKTSVVVANNVR